MTTQPDPALAWPIPYSAVTMIAEAEGLRLKAYRCPAGVWTCGWGDTAGVTPTTEWTLKEAEQRLCGALASFTVKVRALCANEPTANELGALVSLAYNIGVGALAKSTVLRRHNAGDLAAAARAFGLWDKATVRGVLQSLPGLTARRAAEAALYLKPDDGAPMLRMPQAVASESSVASSPIARSGAVAAGTGVLGLLGEAGGHLGEVGTVTQQAKSIVVETLGIPPSAFLPVVLVACGGAAVYWRWRQRRAGWA